MSATTRATTRTSGALVIAAILAVAFNLRTAINVVGPLIPTIRADLGVSNVAMGLIGTIPVLAFGLVSPVAPILGRRFGIGRVLAGSLVLLSVSIGARSLGGYGWLAAGTVGLGTAIAVGNVLLPALIKRRFPDRVSQLSTLYTAVIVVAATMAAGAAVPLAQAVSWQASAAVWAIPAVIGAGVVMLAVIIQGRMAPKDSAAVPDARGMRMRQMQRSRLAWQTTGFMGLQSTSFYVVLAWLPDILISRGLSDVEAGAMVSLFNIAGLVGVLAVPLLHRGRPDQRRSMAAGLGCSIVGVALLLLPGTTTAPVTAFLLGVGAGASLSLALSFFALRTTSAADAATLSGMAQTFGYLIAAGGPVLWGFVNQTTGSWTLPIVLLLAVTIATLALGLAAARDDVVMAPDARVRQ